MLTFSFQFYLIVYLTTKQLWEAWSHWTPESATASPTLGYHHLHKVKPFSFPLSVRLTVTPPYQARHSLYRRKFQRTCSHHQGQTRATTRQLTPRLNTEACQTHNTSQLPWYSILIKSLGYTRHLGNRNIWFPGRAWEPSRPPNVSLASSDQDPSVIVQYDWTDQSNFPLPSSNHILPSKLIVIFLSIILRTSTSIEQSYWPVQDDSPILFDQVYTFSNFKQYDWTVPSWLSHLLKSHWELLSILRNAIGPIYWRRFTSLKGLYWLISEEPSPIWAIWLARLIQFPYLQE